MKLKILKDHDHELTPANVMAFKKGASVEVPKEIGDALLAKDGVAEVDATKTTLKKEA